MMEDVVAKTSWKEVRELKKENNKRWEENDKHWEENNKMWLDSKKQRDKDRKELFDVLDNMDKSISKGLNYMEKYIDDRCRKLEDEHFECKKNCLLLGREIDVQKSRLNFQNVRIESLEKWRDNLGDNFVGIN